MAPKIKTILSPGNDTGYQLLHKKAISFYCDSPGINVWEEKLSPNATPGSIHTPKVNGIYEGAILKNTLSVL